LMLEELVRKQRDRDGPIDQVIKFLAADFTDKR
jgi:hypothetical protein